MNINNAKKLTKLILVNVFFLYVSCRVVSSFAVATKDTPLIATHAYAFKTAASSFIGRCYPNYLKVLGPRTIEVTALKSSIVPVDDSNIPLKRNADDKSAGKYRIPGQIRPVGLDILINEGMCPRLARYLLAEDYKINDAEDIAIQTIEQAAIGARTLILPTKKPLSLVDVSKYAFTYLNTHQGTSFEQVKNIFQISGQRKALIVKFSLIT